MTESDDDKWLEALAGRGTLDDGKEQALLDALRTSAAGDRHDAQGLEKLLRRLEIEGLLEAEGSAPDHANVIPMKRPAEPDKAPQAPAGSEAPPMRWLALAASVAVLSIAGALGYYANLSVSDPPWLIDQTVRGSTAPVEVAVDDPRRASARLADELSTLGIDTARYRHGGRWIVDATVLGPEVTQVSALLGEYNVAVPSHGRVLLAFDKSD